MKTGIWQLAIPSLLCLSIAAQVQADDRPPEGPRGPDQQNQQRNDERQQNQQMHQQQREQQRQIQDQQNQQRNVERQQQQQQQQIQQQQREQQRQIQDQQNQQRNVERQQQQQVQQQQREQQRQIQEQQNQQRNMERQQNQQRYQQQEQQRQVQDQQRQQMQQNRNNLPIQGRPDQVWQTQPPRQGHYEDLPRNQRPRENWPGRPDGRGDGWGGGPRYRPGQNIDRVPGGYARIPWRGRDYFYADGYWYQPQGARYVVVTPPYGMRVRSLPAYSQEVWAGSSLLFLAAGIYYAWQADTQDYVVVNPPQQPAYNQASGNNGYDPAFYPVAGQTQQQVEYDRYQCYRWAVEQSGFDPASMTYPPSDQVVDIYRRSMAACLSERGYRTQ